MKKGDTGVKVDDEHTKLATELRKRPMKKMPKNMPTFSSFVRCQKNSPPKSLLSSPSHHSFDDGGNSDSHGRNAKNIEEIESSSDDDYEDEYQEEGETVQVDFEFFDPKAEDFHGVKLLLQKYLDNYQWDLSGFVDLVLAQTTVGTVVKSADSEGDSNDTNGNRDGADEEELFVVITALNLARYQDNQRIKEFKQYLLGKCKAENTKVKLRQVLEEEVVMYFIKRSHFTCSIFYANYYYIIVIVRTRKLK